MFTNTNMGGLNLAFPDVCLTPPFGEPIPYPNISMPETAIPTQFNVLIECLPAHNMLTEAPFSQGDDTGLYGGVISHMDMGPTDHLMGAFCCLVVGPPATTWLDMTGQNGPLPNMVGATLVPCQPTVMMLC